MATTDPEMIRSSSRMNYGTSREDVEADIRKLVFGRHETGNDDLGPKRRNSGGGAS